ncbi:DUF3102 family protein [Natranaerovirga pectinivora]|uniref:DUF3102 family protein n=1 Tax=Natranaerovirga pectinivora TaxID=682400 RepID=A0A4R3MN04_9FIRM|nr:DUF3102 domain-containing protein [Natranaerovirga pectinivora]TCT16373.1 DUF3102 family protein [Natranaerovirga pectinivora]
MNYGDFSTELIENDNPELLKIEKEILYQKQQTVKSILEIGKNLIAAKQIVEHGEWTKWLTNKVDFSDRTAQKFIKCYKEFSQKPNLISDLNQTKIFALLDIKKEKRENFIENNDVKNLKTNQLKQKIRDFNKGIKNINDALNENVVADMDLEQIEEIEKEVIEQKQKLGQAEKVLIVNKYKKHLEYGADFTIETEEVLENFGQVFEFDLKYNFFLVRNNKRVLVFKNISCASISIFSMESNYFGEYRFNKMELEQEIKEALVLKIIEIQRICEQRRDALRKDSINKWTKDQFEELSTPKVTEQQQELKQTLKKFYRTLVKSYHPDNGGTDVEMTILNQLKEQWNV